MHEVKASSQDFLAITGEVLQAGGNMRFEAHGKSMMPAIRDGDILVVCPLTRRARSGDVLLAMSAQGRPLVHRVLKVKRHANGKLAFLLAGDANTCTDGWIIEDQALGSVASIERKGKFKQVTTVGNLFYLLQARTRFLCRRIAKKIRLSVST
jgi:signal peptidase I